MSLSLQRQRHSVRNFTSAPLDHDTVNALNSAITDINTHEAGMHIQLITDDPAPFSGFTRSYGFFYGVRNYIAVVADTSFAHYRERAGFFGMQLTMRALELGLGSCFVSGTYSSSHVDARVRVGQSLIFLIALGREDTAHRQGLLSRLMLAHMHRRHPSREEFLVSEIPADTLYSDMPQLQEVLTAMSLAPSAMNKRPARLHVRKCDGEYEISAAVSDSDPSQEIDLGIAMWAISDVWPGEWDWGNPARFFPL